MGKLARGFYPVTITHASPRKNINNMGPWITPILF